MASPDALLARVPSLPSVAYADRRTLLPNKPGLYIAYREGPELLYIGMSTKSIRGRWKAGFHDGAAQIEKRGLQGQTRIAYIVYSDAASVVEDEKAAIRTFSPTYNYSHVPGAFEREMRRREEECRYINCHSHLHSTVAPLGPLTDLDVCDCGTPVCELYPPA